MKIGLIGLGYWGKIILKNLEGLGHKDIVVCENDDHRRGQVVSPYQKVKHYKELQKHDVECVFVITPAAQHYDICKYFLEDGVHVFCEKPLSLSVKECQELYSLAYQNECNLFVDWIFTFNAELKTIKKYLDSAQLGKLYSVFFNRLNFGPVRHDVSARIDLASHDLSIIFWLFENNKLVSSQWLDYQNNHKTLMKDSAIGVLKFEEFVAVINASWHYPIKNRECIFAFEKGILKWDDITQQVWFNNKLVETPKELSPLEKSINEFFSFSAEKMKKQQILTQQVTALLEEGV
jgi:predicted dehydrogenase